MYYEQYGMSGLDGGLKKFLKRLVKKAVELPLKFNAAIGDPISQRILAAQQKQPEFDTPASAPVPELPAELQPPPAIAVPAPPVQTPTPISYGYGPSSPLPVPVPVPVPSEEEQPSVRASLFDGQTLMILAGLTAAAYLMFGKPKPIAPFRARRRRRR
jgi:hypothetical protein